MTDLIHRTARLALIALLGTVLAACSKASTPDAPARAAGPPRGPTPVTAAPDPTPALPAVAAAPARIVKGEATVQGTRTETDDDYYPAPKPPPESALDREMREPWPSLAPVEARYFSGKYLDNDVLEKAMRRKDFDGSVLDLQNAGDAGALARQQTYAAALQKSLQPYADRARLGRVGCGAVLCMGSVRASRTDWVNQWTIDLHEKQALPMPSLSVGAIKLGAGEYDIRFSFTTAGAGGFVSKAR